MGEPLDQALRRLYVTENRDQAEIAESLGIEQSTVSRWLKDFGITRF